MRGHGHVEVPRSVLHDALLGPHAVLEVLDHGDGLVRAIAFNQEGHLVDNLRDRGSWWQLGGCEQGSQKNKCLALMLHAYLVIKVLDGDDVARGGQVHDALLDLGGEHLQREEESHCGDEVQ